ncbi:hypothetical protein [Enterococcus gilvus]|uniref:hypothetical protein n=1 Tax=Enterococcus gilvus TaxID=160453 RepID=UPI00290BA53E|nr:hypothetical protein [Enterococcus gilvus]MDU5511794.1 hypothetical protein [Enterococcus gilvus]
MMKELRNENMNEKERMKAMTVGIYLASYHKLAITLKTNASASLSFNELCRLQDDAAILQDMETNLGIKVNEIDPNEKMFMLLQDDEETFSIQRDREKGTIDRYTDKPFIYYITIYDWDRVYTPLSEYLQTLDVPFELWRIWEGKAELGDLERITVKKVYKQTVKKVIGANEYLNPIVGCF